MWGKDKNIVRVGGSNDGKVTQATESGTSRTLALTDKVVRCTSSDAVTITIPLYSSAPFTAGMVIIIRREGTGENTLEATSGLVMNGVDGGSCSINNQGEEIKIEFTAQNECWVTGAHGGVS